MQNQIQPKHFTFGSHSHTQTHQWAAAAMQSTARTTGCKLGFAVLPKETGIKTTSLTVTGQSALPTELWPSQFTNTDFCVCEPMRNSQWLILTNFKSSFAEIVGVSVSPARVYGYHSNRGYISFLLAVRNACQHLEVFGSSFLDVLLSPAAVYRPRSN